MATAKKPAAKKATPVKKAAPAAPNRINTKGVQKSAPSKVTKTQLLKLIDDLKKKPEDKGRILGEIGITAVGATLGAGAAGTVAAAAGATTILGSTVLGSALGGVFVAATPVGWVLGSAAAAGAAVYAVSRLIRNGGMSEGRKAELLNRYSEEERVIAAKEEAGSIAESDRTRFIVDLRELIDKEVIGAEKAFRLIEQVQSGRLPISRALSLIRDLLKEAE